MTKKSAGVLMYRPNGAAFEFFLVHPGGPFWAKKDAGAWSIPKGLMEENESAERAARREFEEETSLPLEGPMIDLGAYRQRGGKIIEAWAIEGDCDPTKIRSNNFEMEWPPKSGRKAAFPEVDRAAWYDKKTATIKIIEGQRPILDALCKKLGFEAGDK